MVCKVSRAFFCFENNWCVFFSSRGPLGPKKTTKNHYALFIWSFNLLSTRSSGRAKPKRSLYQIQHFWMERSIHTQVIQILRYSSIVSMYQPSNAALTATLGTKANECLWSRAWTANTRTSTPAPLSVNLQPSSSSLALAVSRCSVGTRRATGSLPSFHSLVAREEPWVILTMKLSLQEEMS